MTGTFITIFGSALVAFLIALFIVRREEKAGLAPYADRTALTELVDEPVLIRVVDDQGVEANFEVVDVLQIEYAGELREYALVVEEHAENPDEVMVLRVIGDTLFSIEEDAEFQAVVAVLVGPRIDLAA